MDAPGLREGLTLFSAISLFIGMLIDERDNRAIDRLRDAQSGEDRHKNALERALFHLQKRSWRSRIALCLKAGGGIALAAAGYLYFFG